MIIISVLLSSSLSSLNCHHPCQVNEKGQVIAQSQVMKDLEKTVKIEEEKGLTCCICREGYENEPKKVRPAHPPARVPELVKRTNVCVRYITVALLLLVPPVFSAPWSVHIHQALQCGRV